MDNVFDTARSMISRSWIESNFSSKGSYWKGDEFYTLNPIRRDSEIGSFSINGAKGKWYDFVEDGKGPNHGDVFDLLAAIRGVEPVDIAREVAGTTAPPRQVAHQPKPRETERPNVTPTVVHEPITVDLDQIIDWAPIAEGEHPPLSANPTDVTWYVHNATGERCFIVARWDPPGGKKHILPMFKRSDGQWVPGLPNQFKGSENPRPLLPVGKDKIVVVVEGEVKKKKLEAKCPEYSVTTWHGGASQSVDVSILSGCDVVIWPDNDDPGFKAAKKLYNSCLQIAKSVRMVVVPEGCSKGWDAADCIEQGLDPHVFIETSGVVEETQIEAAGTATRRPYTDLGNAERIIDLFGSQARYDRDRGNWLVWTGKIWSDRDDGFISSMYKAVIESIKADNLEVSQRFAAMSQSANRIDAMLRLASREKGVGVRQEDFDPALFFLNCPNGVVDLRDGSIRKQEPDFLLSKMTEADYNPEAKCPRFLQFLEEIFLGRSDLIEMLQRWFGYSASGDITAQAFMIFYGAGANGKSTLTEVLSRVLGTYSRPAPPDTFITKNSGSGIPNDIAALRGARLVLTSETESNAKLAESKIKNITGGERVSARYMRGEFFDFLPTWKIIISTNHKPRITGSDYGIWRRVVLVPFDFVATAANMDPMLPRKLWAEKEGILAWIVEGARKWHADGEGRIGLKIPESIMQATQDYRQDEDLIARFISQGCVKRGDQAWREGVDYRVSSKLLYQAFISWAEGDGERYAAQMTHTSFGRALSDRGYKSVKTRNGDRGFDGLVPLGIRTKDVG